MERSRIWMWTVFFALVLAVLFFLFWPRGERMNWAETYRPDSAQPYGTQVVHELLKDQAGSDRFVIVKDSLIGALGKWEESPANFVFIGSGMWLDSLEEVHLINFAKKGNTVFLSSPVMPFVFLEQLLPEYCDLDRMEAEGAYFTDTSATVSLTHPGWEKSGMELRFLYPEGIPEYDWHHLDPVLSCMGIVLGRLNGYEANFLKIPLGEGTVLLHTTPLAFSNYFIREEAGLDYAEKVLAYLNEGPVYWDRYSDYEAASRREWGLDQPRTTRTVSGEGPLQYILSQASLAWGWYVGLAMALLFLLFRAKRKQRIIPVLEPNTNTSMEFIATIGQLYFRQNNHRKLALQKWKLFLGFIRDRYHLSTRDLDEAFINKLSERSGLEEASLSPLFRLARNIERSEVFLSENTLIDLHKLLDHFYRHCK